MTAPLAEQNSRRWNRMSLLLIGGVPILVMITATWLWVYVERGDLDLVALLGTSNRGKLVQPAQQISSLQPRQLTGEPFDNGSLPPQWTLLVPGTADCIEACAQTLYLTRQIHTALGPEAPRVRRFYLNLDDSQSEGTRALIEDKHPNLKTMVASRVNFLEMLGAAGLGEGALAPGTWYVVDPMGWVMMYYTVNNNYKDAITDLKFLLKNTSEAGLR